MKRLFLTLAFLALASAAFGQGNHIYTSGTTPTSCRVGDIFIKTASGNNPRQFVCTASNIWSPVSVTQTYVTKTGDYTLTAVDGTVELLTNIGTFTLPTAVGIQGRLYLLKNLQTANALTIATTSAQTIDGAAPGTITNGCLQVVSDGSNWRIAGACGFPLTSLTSGGVIYASSAVSVASSGVLGAGQVVLGGGAGAAPTSTASLVLPFHVFFDAGASQAGTASIGLSMPATLNPTAISQNGAAGGNAAYGLASFLNSEIDELQGHFPLTPDWSSAQGIDLRIKWRAISTTANDVRFQIRTKCVATGEADTAVSYNAAQSTTAVTNLGTTLQWNLSSQTGLTLTGCSAGEEFFFIISRDTSVSGDTLDQPVQVSGLDFTYRRTVVIGG
jgi:hypothetical protein